MVTGESAYYAAPKE